MATPPQKPLEMIQARNLLSCLSTPGVLVNRDGDVIYFNGPAGALLGHRFEDTGRLSASEWVSKFGPLDERGEPVPVEQQALTGALRANRAGHAVERIRSARGEHSVEVSGVPIVGGDGFQGAMIFFWSSADGELPREGGE